jgi:hypothetical protein
MRLGSNGAAVLTIDMFFSKLSSLLIGGYLIKSILLRLP